MRSPLSRTGRLLRLRLLHLTPDLRLDMTRYRALRNKMTSLCHRPNHRPQTYRPRRSPSQDTMDVDPHFRNTPKRVVVTDPLRPCLCLHLRHLRIRHRQPSHQALLRPKSRSLCQSLRRSSASERLQHSVRLPRFLSAIPGHHRSRHERLRHLREKRLRRQKPQRLPVWPRHPTILREAGSLLTRT